jgi:hypothetical protein
VSEAGDPGATPEQVEEGDAQRYLEHEDPDAERERAGLGGEEGGGTEPLPDHRRDEA